MTAFKRAPAVLIAAIAAVLSLGASSYAYQNQDSHGSRIDNRVYVMPNRAGANTIAIFDRAQDGTLTFLREVPTGGTGSGPGQLPAPFPAGIPGGNPLTSQDSLVRTDDGRFLIAVNAGSNDISVLAITEDGLQFVDKAPSGGNVPVSIAHYNNLVYVINEGQFSPDLLGAQPTMTGYFIGHDGKLTPIPNSARVTGAPNAEPGDILFSPDGKWLIITDKFAQTLIHVLKIDEDATTHEVGTYVSNTPAPLGAAFTHHRILAVTEANATFVNGTRTGVTDGSTMSSYKLTEDGTLEKISVAVPTDQTATCWVRFTPDGHYAYVTNKGSGSISSFTITPDGKLTLLASVATETGSDFSLPIDEDITDNGKFLYVLTSMGALPGVVVPVPPNSGALLGYRIENDGSLTPIVNIPGFPISVVGIVAH